VVGVADRPTAALSDLDDHHQTVLLDPAACSRDKGHGRARVEPLPLDDPPAAPFDA
jgi:hypothetical protein